MGKVYRVNILLGNGEIDEYYVEAENEEEAVEIVKEIFADNNGHEPHPDDVWAVEAEENFEDREIWEVEEDDGY